MNLEIVEIVSTTSKTAKIMIDYDEEFEDLVRLALHKSNLSREEIERYVAQRIEKILLEDETQIF
jgi:hypothetical protein